ncbi:TonB-dependent receptor domain-containing protein [Steroidobacter cummioxidans]|uniref:TonB-dependent receptor domain-containing protein n=1 Tax=Steroidobacter cummioxidans TaxID=1803913 RepID=UPI000E31A076|nr:TonB-dependent receptor [Steroidobacter cummioxidans]
MDRRIAAMLIAGGAGMVSTLTHAQAQNDAPALEEVTVTGSRVITNGDYSPTPVTVVSTQEVLAAQPGTLADALNILPVFSGSRGSGSNPTSTGTVSAGNASANQLNLRNVGAIRTLVLLDGLRVPPTLINGIVDVDLIPQMLVQRVDTVTGGVSAVYGSDAISGVVNYILNKKFQGLETRVNGGVSDYGDANKYNAAIAAGTALFDGRGHIEASYEYRKEEGIASRSDRPYMNLVGVAGSVPGAPSPGSAQNPYEMYSDLRQAQYPFGGLIRSGIYTNQTFSSDGVLSPFAAGTPTGTNGLQIGGGGGYYDSSLLAPMEGHQYFGRFQFDFTDRLQGYVQIAGNIKSNEVFGEYLLYDRNFSAQNAFLSPTYQAAMQAAGQATFRMTGLLQTGPRFESNSESDQRVYTAGLKGSLGEYDWGVSYVFGTTQLETALGRNVNAQRLAYALDAVRDSGGNIVCNITLTNPSLGQDCVPLNVFGPTAANAAAFDYVMQPTRFAGETNMSDVSAYISGSPFDNWAGPVNVALSAEYRDQSFEGESDGEPSNVLNCAGLGIRFNNCRDGDPIWIQSFADVPKVSQNVWETALEFGVPLVKDSVNLSAAGRYTSYNTSGDYWTWKFGVDWQVLDSLRFRATRSRDIRAPTLSDLYAPDNFVYVQPTDLLTGTSPRVQSRDRSNQILTAEIGNTVTAGFVWRPMPELSVALDGYRIVVSDAITQVNGATTAFQNQCYASGGTSPYCELQDRPNGFTDTSAANAVTAWYNVWLNISEIETYGADLEVNWNSTLFDRPLAIRFLGAYQPHIYYRQPNLPVTDQGGVGFGPLGAAASPSVRLTGLVRFQPVENFTVDLMQRWRNAMDLGGDPTQSWVSNHVESFATTNINVAYQHRTGAMTMEYYVNVQNVFNADAPNGAYSGNGTRAGLRDGFAMSDSPLGRFYLAGINVKL